jgi:hypothetical protein
MVSLSAGCLASQPRETKQHSGRAEKNKFAYLIAPGNRNLKNAWMDSSFFHVYSIQAHSLWDGAAHIQGESSPLNYCPTY